MPGVGGVGQPYPTIESVMQGARARINDMLNDTTGDILTDDAPFAQTYLSMAWEWYQERCAAEGIETLIRDVVFTGIPLRATDDVANQCYLSWLGCGDGVNQYTNPALPQDCIMPMSVWRRQTGVLTFPLHPMRQAEDGLPGMLDCNVYDWRDDGLYFYGDTVTQDFRIRYAAYRPELSLQTPTALVPMMRCRNPLAARVAFEYASARGAAEAPAMQALADKEFDDGPGNRTSKRKQRGTTRRIPAFGANRTNIFGRWPINL